MHEQHLVALNNLWHKLLEGGIGGGGADPACDVPQTTVFLMEERKFPTFFFLGGGLYS